MTGRADSMTYGAQNFAEYLAAYRAQAAVTASPILTNAEVLALDKDQFITIHEESVKLQYLGDDALGDPVWRFGTVIVLQDLTVQLAALVAAGSLKVIPGAEAAYSLMPSLRS